MRPTQGPYTSSLFSRSGATTGASRARNDRATRFTTRPSLNTRKADSTPHVRSRVRSARVAARPADEAANLNPRKAESRSDVRAHIRFARVGRRASEAERRGLAVEHRPVAPDLRSDRCRAGPARRRAALHSHAGL